MSEHPGDSPLNRFRAFWTGLLAFVGFGLVLWVVLKSAGPRDIVEPGWAERGEERAANLVEVLAAQEAALPADEIQGAVQSTITSLQGKKAGKSEVVVPGSPTFIKQSQQPAGEVSSEEPAEGGPKEPEAAPAPEKPAEAKPAEAKPAEAKPEEKDAPAAQ